MSDDTLAVAIRAEAEIADRPGQMDRLRDLADQVEALGDAVDLVGENFDRQAAELDAARRETAVVTRESRRRTTAATARAERAEAAIQRVRAVEQKLWEQVAQLKAMWVEVRAEMDPFDRGRMNGLGEAHGDLLAALDGTDNTGGTDERPST